VRSKPEENDHLTIEVANKNCRDKIFWQVIGDCCYNNMKSAVSDDTNGRIIVKPRK